MLARLRCWANAAISWSFLALRAVNPGFDPHGVLTLQMTLSGTRFQRTRDVAQLSREGVRRLQAVPGVDAAITAAFERGERDSVIEAAAKSLK